MKKIKSRIFNEEQIKFFIENHKGKTAADIAGIMNKKFNLNISEQTVRSFRKNHKLNASENVKVRKKIFNTEQHEYFLTIQYGEIAADVAEMMNKKFGLNLTGTQIRSYRKSKKIPSGLVGNGLKGKRRKNMSSSWFTKGMKPHNYAEIGEERKNAGYTLVKVGEGKWKNKTQIIWEQHHGEIPKGKKVIVLDGDKDNHDINNLALVSQGELVTLNRRGHITPDGEVTRFALTKIKLENTIKKIKERKKDNEST